MQEPLKADYLAWKNEGAALPPREASVCLQALPNPLVLCCCVDLKAESVTSWKEVRA